MSMGSRKSYRMPKDEREKLKKSLKEFAPNFEREPTFPKGRLWGKWNY